MTIYNKYEIKNFHIRRNNIGFELGFNVRNTKEIDGKEIVEIYVTDLDDPYQVPILKGFKKVEVLSNSEVFVEMLIENDAFERFNTKDKEYHIKHGKYLISIGQSLNDIRKVYEVEI